MDEARMAISRRRALALAAAKAAAPRAPLPAPHPVMGRPGPPGPPARPVQAKNYSFTPDRIEVFQGDRVRLTIEGGDQVHSFAIDEYRIARRIVPGTPAIVDFRAERAGTFTYFCNIGTDPGCKAMRGTLVVAAK